MSCLKSLICVRYTFLHTSDYNAGINVHSKIILLICRDYGDGVVEMSCTFEHFDTEILNTPLPYKYVVTSPKVKKTEESYEYLHAHSHSTTWRDRDYNRCLVIAAEDRHFPTGRIMCNYLYCTMVESLNFFLLGEYHRYDSIAYPKNTKISKSFLKNVKERAFGLLSFVSGGYLGRSREKEATEEIPENFTPLSHQEMSEFCLKCYLFGIEDILCSGSFPAGQDISTIALEISFIYNSLSVECVSVATDPINRVKPEHKRVDGADFKKVRHAWIYCIVGNFGEQ